MFAIVTWVYLSAIVEKEKIVESQLCWEFVNILTRGHFRMKMLTGDFFHTLNVTVECDKAFDVLKQTLGHIKPAAKPTRIWRCFKISSFFKLSP